MRQEAEKKRLLKERKDRDAESKRNLEDIQRNLKIQEKKNADRAKYLGFITTQLVISFILFVCLF